MVTRRNITRRRRCRCCRYYRIINCFRKNWSFIFFSWFLVFLFDISAWTWCCCWKSSCCCRYVLWRFVGRRRSKGLIQWSSVWINLLWFFTVVWLLLKFKFFPRMILWIGGFIFTLLLLLIIMRTLLWLLMKQFFFVVIRERNVVFWVTVVRIFVKPSLILTIFVERNLRRSYPT